MKKFLQEFKAFALRGNVMDMAIGMLIGAGFSGIVTALTENFINPLLQVILGSMNPQRIRDAAKGSDLPLTRQEWYEIYQASGKKLP